MSEKHCGSHGDHRRKIIRRTIWTVVAFLLIVLLIVVIVWGSLKPSKPRFILQDATVYAFNVSGSPPTRLSSNFQVTISSRNPNDKIGVYYDRLRVFATYRNQQITLPTDIPPTYQGHKEVNIWSPFVYGTSIPVAPYNAVGLSEDQSRGAVLLTVRAEGRVRWKVGTFISGQYRMNVKCPAYIDFGNKGYATDVGNNAVKYSLVTSCSVSV